MKDDISPEERLLKLIRSPKKQNIQDLSGGKKPPLAPAVLDLKPARKAPLLPSIQKYFSFIYFQKIITLVFIISGIFFIFSFISPRIGFKKNDLPSLAEEKITGPEIEFKKEEVRPYEFYLEGVKGRQIFTSSSQPETQAATAASVQVNADLIKDMNLVGIISGEPSQAIIEDKKVNKTYYVTKGDSIGEFQVEDIGEGRVTLNYHEHRYELYL